MKKRVVICGSLDVLEHDLEREILRDVADVTVDENFEADEDELIESLRDADGVICDYTTLTARVLRALPRCRVIALMRVGTDLVDLDAATEMGIQICNIPGFNTQEVAEHTITAGLALARDLVRAREEMRLGIWDNTRYLCRSLGTMTWGVLGFGDIGRLTALMARGLFGRVLARSRSRRIGEEAEQGVFVVSLEDLLAQSDILSVSVPLAPDTRGLIGAEAIARMKPGSYIVSIARDGVVDQDALVAALQSGHLAGAALDVMPGEPKVSGNPLLSFPNVIATPHMAWRSEHSLKRIVEWPAEQVRDVLMGKQPAYPVNRLGV